MLSLRTTQVWLAAVALFAGLVWLFKPVLAPFLIGIAVAYVLDPVVERLSRLGLSRVAATALVLVSFFAVAGAAVALAVPLVGSQAAALAAKMPEYGRGLTALVDTKLLPFIHSHVDQETFAQAQDSLGGASVSLFKWIAGTVTELLTSGSHLLSLLSVAFIAPVVSFYLVRDWPGFVARIEDTVPRGAAPTVRKLATGIDERIDAFFRGQAMVAVCFATFYSIALPMVGLEFGFVIGVASGLLSFVPYVGAAIGMATAATLAAVQFQSAVGVAQVLAVFGIAQVIDAAYLTPKLVGDRVGLHPVWIIFAVMAGGTLAGFAGVLLAVPTAAAVGVVLEHLLERYKASALYSGTGDDEREAA